MNDHNLKPLAHGALNHCFGCGQVNRSGLKLRFFVDEEQTIICRLRLARRFEGPPRHAHGGVIATLLDEAMSKANRQFGVLAMTRQMEVDYLKPVPLGVPLRLTGRRVNSAGRIHHCEAQLAAEDGLVLAKAKGLFIAVDPALPRRGQKAI